MTNKVIRVLLVGGSGLLSGAARETFLEAGYRVTVLSRGIRPLPPHPRLEELRADRCDVASLADALGGRSFDMTVDFLAYCADDVRRLFAVPGFQPGRLVMISSGQVYLVTEGKKPPFREEDSDAPLMAAPREGTRDRREWDYGMGKRAAEEALRREGESRGIRTLALRLPVVQGEGDGWASRRLWAWLERMKDGGPVLLPDGGKQTVRFVYSGDVALALRRLLEGEAWPEAAALNLAQPAESTLREFLGLVASCAGLEPDFLPVPAEDLRAAELADTCAPYWGGWCSRPAPAAAFLLGFTARDPHEYLPSVVRAHLAAALPGSHPGYARRDEELRLASRLRRV